MSPAKIRDYDSSMNQNGQIVEWNTKRLGFGPIWPENLDKIRMRSIFARYLRNIDQIFPLIQKQKFDRQALNESAHT
jgi:hypothetical protein